MSDDGLNGSKIDRRQRSDGGERERVCKLRSRRWGLGAAGGGRLARIVLIFFGQPLVVMVVETEPATATATGIGTGTATQPESQQNMTVL